MERPKSKSDIIREWLKRHPRGSYAAFCEAYPELEEEISSSLFAHVSKSRRKLKKLRPKLKGRLVTAEKKAASG